ncbi:MAG: CsbD family protein [Tranquillimonas sp.]|jgi:uncharacterized protein YjbJ (UPF0337 family)
MTKSSDENRVEGSGDDLGGKIKEGAGNLTGDRDLEAEGKTDQAKGKAKQAWADLKDAAKK